MPKFIIKKSLIHKGKIYEPGEAIALDDRKGATDLFNRGYIDAPEEQPPPSLPPASGAPASGPATAPLRGHPGDALGERIVRPTSNEPASGTASAKPAATKADVLPK